MTTVTRLMTGYAIVALLLAVAGTYAVLAYLVTQRRRELAIRIALGATPWAVVGLVARESTLLVGIGVVTGLLGAAASARLLSGMLYGITTLDPSVVLLVVAGAAAAGCAAAFVPARRATRLHPGHVLRGDG
jgi:ABC-type antimicrobial peptide transport system permease subunit